MNRDNDTDGLAVGVPLLAVVLMISVWFFTIPVELRRARLCTEQQVIDNPQSRCMTWDNWTSGVADYYKNGGGLQFDFSIEREGNQWI
jgi:hypothetical protein